MASIQQLDDNKYKIFVELGYNDFGKRIRRTKTVTVTSERDLKNKIRDFEIYCFTNSNEKLEDITFAGFVKRWEDNHVKPNLELTTHETYEQILKGGGLLEHFAKMKLKDIKKYHINEYFTKEKDKPLLPNKHAVLKSIFTKAVEWELIEKSPVSYIKQPKREKRKVDFYSEEELNHLFKILDNCYPKHRIIVKLAAIGGLRRSEILGIREESINYENNSIYIDKQLRYDKYKKKFYLSTVKNDKPRTVFFPESFMKELKTYHTNFKAQRMELGNLWRGIYDEEGEMINLLLVKEDGYPTHLNTVGNEWTKIKRRYNLKDITFHELRHSCASLMVKKGINFKIIQERLGHANIGITLDLYSHLEDELHIESANIFEELF